MAISSEFLQLSLILIVAAFAIPISRKVSVIEIPILIGLGILFGPVLGIISHGFAINFMSQFATVGIGLLGIMIILYSESHRIDIRLFRRLLSKIVLLDTLGLLITAFVTAFLFSLITGAPLIIGFIFGAIISPTDPASVIPLLRRMTLSEDVTGTLIGESMFNDPLSIILFYLGIALIAPGISQVTIFSDLNVRFGIYAATLLYLMMQILIPAVSGIAVGFLIIYLNKIFNFENLLLGLILGVILLEFAFFEALSLTPFPAIIATGAVIGNFSEKSIFWEREANFQANLAVLAQSIIFLLLGSIITLGQITSYILLGIIMSLVVMFVARPASVFPSILLASLRRSRVKFGNKVKWFISLVGPRGVVSVVLSAIPYSLGLEYHISILIKWGPVLSVSAIFVVLLSIILTTVYSPTVGRKLIPPPKD